MRISDWSSDVCSSDLQSHFRCAVHRVRRPFSKFRGGCAGQGARACRGSPPAARPAESGRIDDNFPMTINLKTPEEIEKMREAGRLAAEVMQVVAPHVPPGVTTEELDRICYEPIVIDQKANPADRNGAVSGQRVPIA